MSAIIVALPDHATRIDQSAGRAYTLNIVMKQRSATKPETGAAPAPPSALPALPGWAKGTAIFLLIIVAYLPALNAGYIWDDDDYYTENVLLESVEGLWQIWTRPTWIPQYYPVTHTSLWIDYQLWGENPAGSHAVNILLHAGSAVLLWRILRRLRLPAAWLAAALFALHPVHVESVAWITQRKNTLSGLFYLSAALVLVRYFRLSDGDAPERSPTWRLYAIAFGLFVLAVLSKTVTATLPAAIGLVIYWKRGRLARREIVLLLPMLVVGGALGLFTVWMEKINVGATGAAWDLTVLDRLLVAGRIAWFYTWKLLWPASLSFSYARWNINASDPWQYAFPLAVIAVVAALWMLRRYYGRGPLVAVLFFGGTLVPALGFFDVYPFRFSFVADHFQYLASIGLIVLGAEVIWRSIHSPPFSGNVRTLVLIALVAGPALLTAQRCLAFKDLETIWLDTALQTPTSWIAHSSLGTIYRQRGDIERAESYYRRAIALAPHAPEPYASLAMLHDLKRQPDEALALYAKSVKVAPRDVRARYALARALAARDQKDAAIAELRRVLELEPRYELATMDLASILIERGRTDEAIEQYRQSIAANPELVRVRVTLASLLLELRRETEALQILQEAKRIIPTNVSVRLTLGRALIQAGQAEQGLAELVEATRLAPDLPVTHATLAAAYEAQGRTADAARHYRRTLELQPNHPEALEALQRLGLPGL